MKTKTVFLFFILFSIMIYGQSKSSSKLNVDSLFLSHIISLDTTVVCGNSRLVLPTDVKFVHLVSIMSNISFELHSYSGYPLLTVEDMVNIKKWYIKHRIKITSEHVEKVLYLLSNDVGDDFEEEMIKLKIE